MSVPYVASRPSLCPLGPDHKIYIYTIYTLNLGFGITVFDEEREQGRFRGSSEGARGSNEGARGSTEGARGSTVGQCRGAAGGA